MYQSANIKHFIASIGYGIYASFKVSRYHSDRQEHYENLDDNDISDILTYFTNALERYWK